MFPQQSRSKGHHTRACDEPMESGTEHAPGDTQSSQVAESGQSGGNPVAAGLCSGIGIWMNLGGLYGLS